MEKPRFTVTLAVLLGFVVTGAIMSLLLSQFISFKEPQKAQTALAVQQPVKVSGGIVYSPPKVDEAPANMREAIQLGYNIITDTGKYAGEYVGNKLTCANCHFTGGISEGGKNGGLSLVGVAAKYPMYRDRQKAPVDLVIRINDCFERSMNGSIPPNTGKEMQAVMAYLHWISKDMPIYGNVPWLTNPPLSSEHKGDAGTGRAVFAQNCAVCHGSDGGGTVIAPPVYGPMSYNDGAGMANPATLATFAHNNMPKGNPALTVEQALDVAAFVDSQPRPHFAPRQK